MPAVPLRFVWLVFSVFACALILVGRADLSARPSPQTPAPDYLTSGVARVQAGDFQLGIMMLNEVVAPGSKSDAASIARAHAYRAQAFLGLGRQDDARAAVLLALKADSNISVTAPSYSAALVELFRIARGPAAAVSPEIAGAAAEQQGNYQDALAAYLSAYQSLPVAAPAEDDRRLREKIILAARRLNTPPSIPQDARAHYQKAQELFDAQAVLGNAGPASLNAAATELQAAIRLAPWWADATFRLATVLQQLQRVDEALINLNLYRLADPEAATKTGATAKPEPPSGRREATVRLASVFIYWPPQVRSRGTPKVYCDGFLIAELGKGRFVELAVAGGAHEIKFGSKSERFSFEPGSTYYVRASQEGFTRWSPFALRLLDSEEGAAELQEKSITSNDRRRTYTDRCAAPVGKPK